MLLDPYEGARLPGYWAIPGVAAGLVKAAVGLGLRPTIGFLEFCSRNIQGIGLAFQGKQGIQVRRRRDTLPLKGIGML